MSQSEPDPDPNLTLTVSLSLQRMGILNVGQRIEEQAEFEKIYKNGETLGHLG